MRGSAGNITGIEEIPTGNRPSVVRDRNGDIIQTVKPVVGSSRLLDILESVSGGPLNMISAMAGVEEHGITFSRGLENFDPGRDNIYYNGQLVRRLVHETFFENGNVIMTSSDRNGKLSVYVLWDEGGNLTSLNIVE